jgi:hypothetical protein
MEAELRSSSERRKNACRGKSRPRVLTSLQDGLKRNHGAKSTLQKKEKRRNFMKTTGKYAKYLLGIILLLAFTACAGTEKSRSTGTYVDDKVIASKVKTELIANEETKARNIQVEVYQGVVQLSGFVETERSKEMAGDVARRVEGVVDVKNDLIVRK